LNEYVHEESTVSRKLRDVYDLFPEEDNSARKSEIDPYGLKASLL
jgi:hypothetical protein